MESNSSGSALIVAAVIVGVSMIGSAYMLQSAVEQAAVEVTATLADLAKVTGELAKAGPAPSPARPTRSRKPDPSKAYEIALGTAPVKGPKNAEITIVEWSDFQ